MKIYGLIFIILLSIAGFDIWAVCVPTAYDCSYCGATSCSCSNSPVAEPSIVVSTIQFSWSHGDTNISNDVCSGSVGGPCNCNFGTTTYSNNILPAVNAACVWPGARNKMPASGVVCSWRDGACGTYCSSWVSATCMTACPL